MREITELLQVLNIVKSNTFLTDNTKTKVETIMNEILDAIKINKEEIAQ
jgi:transposase-like protein